MTHALQPQPTLDKPGCTSLASVSLSIQIKTEKYFVQFFFPKAITSLISNDKTNYFMLNCRCCLLQISRIFLYEKTVIGVDVKFVLYIG